jgi:aryl-alcohol dehydrogenase-like predicted oxidoreductase
MRLSTAPDRDEAAAIGVIQSALDAGARLLDTADAYCLDEAERGHNERLIAEALRTWAGDRSAVEVATKGGMRRPGGRWVPDGRAKHLKDACEASCRALDIDAIDLYQLHAPDPRTPFETSVRALASLYDAGLVRAVGLCNVTVGQIEAARSIVDVASVQVAMSVLDDSSLRNGVAEYCRDHGIRLIAYRPLGGDRSDRIARNSVLGDIAADHGATPHEIALAWLADLDPVVVTIPGATRIETARSAIRASAIALTVADRTLLDAAFPAGRLLRVPRAQRSPASDADGEVVLVMGIPGAGKSTTAQEFTGKGYGRLNRDQRGGTLSGLVAALDHGLARGERLWVLDNTYPTRRARNEVIECAWSHGVPVRCVWLTTSTPDAQINAIERLLQLHGRLPMPEELSEHGRSDPRWFGPDAQFRFERQLEPPTIDEGFTVVERRPFTRIEQDGSSARAAIFEFDDVLVSGKATGSPALTAADVRLLPGRRERLAELHADGWIIGAIAWRPQIGAGQADESAIRTAFARARDLIGIDIDISFCPHPAGPPLCWCRKPLPGLVLAFAYQHRVAPHRITLFGRSPADRTLASRLGLQMRQPEDEWRD